MILYTGIWTPEEVGVIPKLLLLFALIICDSVQGFDSRATGCSCIILSTILIFALVYFSTFPASPPLLRIAFFPLSSEKAPTHPSKPRGTAYLPLSACLICSYSVFSTGLHRAWGQGLGLIDKYPPVPSTAGFRECWLYEFIHLFTSIYL